MYIDNIKKWATEHVGWQVVWANSSKKFSTGKIVGYNESRIIVDNFKYKQTISSENVWLDKTVDQNAAAYAWVYVHHIQSVTPPLKPPSSEKCRRCGGPAVALFTTVECSANCGGVK